MDGKQAGDPAKLADALVQVIALEEPPVRFAAGADAVGVFERKTQTLLDQANAHRDLSSGLGHDDADPRPSPRRPGMSAPVGVARHVRPSARRHPTT